MPYGRYDALIVEARGMKDPRTLDTDGLPLALTVPRLIDIGQNACRHSSQKSRLGTTCRLCGRKIRRII
jgi:hypothetical protein